MNAIAKSVFTPEYAELISMLRKAREEAGLHQREVAHRIGESTLFVSRCERGERRMDVVEFCAVCIAVGVRPDQLMGDLETKLRARLVAD